MLKTVKASTKFSIVAILGFFLASTSPAQPPGGPPPAAPVMVAPVEGGSFIEPIQLTGEVEALRFTTIAAEQQGVVSELFVDEGDPVTTGTVLLRLRQTPFELEYARAQAEYLADAATLAELKSGARIEDVKVAEAELAQTRADMRQSERDFERSKALLAEGTISTEKFESDKARMESLKAQGDAKAATLERWRTGARPEEIAKAEADAEATRAEAAVAADDLARSTVQAPYAGVLTRRHVDLGAWVNTGQPLFEIAAIDSVRVRMEIPEIFYNRISRGDEIKVTFDAAPQKEFTGTVYQIIPSANTQSRAFPVKIDIANKEHFLAPGMMARIRLAPISGAERSVVIPKDAIVAQGPKPVVFRATTENGKLVAERLEITTGRYYGEAVEVFGPLAPGDKVVIRGNERLQPGQAIEAVTFLAVPKMNSGQETTPNVVPPAQ